ncbi:MAG: arginine deiminase-related protein, partial [Candidatus Dormiibacterota bacterium]
RFYHLDTCFCPLDSDTALCAIEAFSDASKRVIQEQVPNLIRVPADVAAGFACNAMPIGKTVVSALSILSLERELADAGFVTVGLPMGEFRKAGGGVRCLSLPLDLGAS